MPPPSTQNVASEPRCRPRTLTTSLSFLPPHVATIWQFLIGATGSLAASTPYLGGILGVIIVMWINAAKSLAIKFKDVSKDCEL